MWSRLSSQKSNVRTLSSPALVMCKFNLVHGQLVSRYGHVSDHLTVQVIVVGVELNDYQLHPLPPCISPILKTPESAAADSSGTDNVSAESTATRSPNGSASLETADSLQHLDDADSVKFKVKDEEPVVKHIIKGKVGWAPIRVTNHCSMRERSIASVDYLKKCKKISIVYNEDFGWRASIHSGSAWFSTPIASRTRSRTSRDIT